MTPANTAPAAPQIPHERTIHGETVADPWFYLRDREHPETLPYLEAENRYTREAMAGVQDLEAALYREMVGRIQETDSSAPAACGAFEYYTRTLAGAAYTVSCRRPLGGGDEQVLLDCNALAEGQGYFALAWDRVSPDGNWLGYAVDLDGSEVYTARFRDLRTGEILARELPNVYYGAAWADSRYFFYTTLDETKRPYRLWRHEVGGTGEDALIYEERDGRFNVTVERCRSGAFLLMTLDSHSATEVWYLAAGNPTGEFQVLKRRAVDTEYFVEHQGDAFWIRINDAGKNFRLMRAALEDPTPDDWTEVLAHRMDVSIEGVEGFAGHLAVVERSKGLQQLRILLPADHYAAFEEPAYTFSVDQNDEYETARIRLAYSSMVTPRTIYDYDMNARTLEVKKRYAVLGGYDSSNYIAERLMACSHDGFETPISLVRRRDVKPGPETPVYLYGYGSYGIVTEPGFSADRLSLLDRGFVFAMAHIRGSGDLGRYCYDDGKLGRKKNTFLDFVACAQHLIDNGYTSPRYLTIAGGSAGGLLMGAVVNMRPDLSHAAVAHVPFVDVVNTMLDETLPLTVPEYEEWGNPREKAVYEYIRSYAPYENIERKAYPNILATGGLNDPRVPYWEPAKWVAKLRALKTDSNLILLKTNMGAGHGGPSGRYARLREKAFEYAFVVAAQAE